MKSVAADQIKRACQDYRGGGEAGPPTHPHATALRGNFALLPHCYNLLVLSSFFSSLDSLINLFTEESNSKGLFKEAEKENIQAPRPKHSLVITTHIFSCSEWAQLYANFKSSVTCM